MTGRPRAASDDAIFDAVSGVITDHGPGGLTLAAVAARAGVSAPALAQRFGSKRNLLLAYARAAATGTDSLFEEARNKAADPLSALQSALLAFSSGVSTRTAMANNLAFLHLDLSDPELGAHAAEQSRRLRTSIAGLLAEAAQAGMLRADTDAAELADTVYTIYNGALVTWAIDGRGSLSRWLRDRLDRSLRPHLREEPKPSRR